MADNTGNLNLVHGKNHGRRRAVPPQFLAEIRQLAEAAAEAAQFNRHTSAKQPFAAQRIYRLMGKAGMAVYIGGRRACDILPDFTD